MKPKLTILEKQQQYNESSIGYIKPKYLYEILSKLSASENFFESDKSWGKIKLELLKNGQEVPESGQLPELLFTFQEVVYEPTKQLYTLFNFSIFNGEYYIEETLVILNKISISIIETQKSISKFVGQQADPSNFISKIFTAIDELSIIFETIKLYIKYYIQLTNRISARLRMSKSKIIDFDFENSLDSFLNNKSSADVNNAEIIFILNVRVCLLDEGHLCNEDTLFYLIKISSKIIGEIEKKDFITIDGTVSKIILDKVDFLIYKILLRFNKDSAKEYIISAASKTSDYSLPHFDKEFSPQDYLFKTFYDKANKHYAYRDFKLDTQEIEVIEKRCVEKIFTNNPIEIEVYPIHKLCKYYKRAIKSKSAICFDDKIYLLEQLANELENLRNDSKLAKDMMNYFAYETTYSLIQNTKFRLVVEVEKSRISNLDNLVESWDKIKTVFEKNHNEYKLNQNSHFQLYKLYSNAIIEFLSITYEILKKIIFETNTSKVASVFVNSLLSEYHEANVLFNKILILNKESSLLPVYMTMNECFVKYTYEEETDEGKKISDLNIFLDSSYILPSNYDYVLKKKEEENLEFNRYLFLCTDQIHYAQENQIQNIVQAESSKLTIEFDNREKKFDDKVKDSQLNAIQLIGLYAGLITFVLGSVSIIPKFERSYTAILLFLFVFASCLSIFVALLRLIFNKDNEYLSFSDIFYKRSEEKEGIKPKNKYSKYAIFIAYNFGIFCIAITLIFIYKDQNERGYERTIEIRSNYHYIQSKNKTFDSLIKKDVDTTQSKFSFQIDPNVHKDTLSKKKK